MGYQRGDRVGAILKSEGDSVWLFGYGTYQGEQVPAKKLGVKIFGISMDHENPCLLLDSGKQVFGCECWWGPEDQIKTMVSRYPNVHDADIEEMRRAAKAFSRATDPDKTHTTSRPKAKEKR